MCEKVMVKLLHTSKVPARHEGWVSVVSSTCNEFQGDAMFEPLSEWEAELGVEWVSGVTSLKAGKSVVVQVRNVGTVPLTLLAGTEVGHLEPLENYNLTELHADSTVSLEESLPLGREEREDMKGERVRLLSSVAGPDLDLERKRKLCDVLGLSDLPIGLEDRDRVAKLIFEFQDVFALTDAELGVTDRACHQLDTGNSAPIKQYARRIPFSLRGPVEEAVNDMLQRGIVRPSSSPWMSPVVLVKKKEGTYRFCVDYRKINAVTKTAVFPLPRIEDYLDALVGVQYFTTLDLASRFWQVPVHPDSIEKTAFVSHMGFYEFLVMPFGLKNAPATFQKLMADVLRGLSQEVCMDYIDDILVVGKSADEHLVNLRIVLQRLREAGLKLKPSKCNLFKTKVKYLGFVVSMAGIEVDPDKTRAVREFPIPLDIRSLRGFLGLTSYYRRFVESYSRLAKPLYHLTQKGVPYRWTPECQQAFDTLKDKLTSAPILVYLDFEVPFVLEMDASHCGLGAVLAQRQADGSTRPIAYASRTLQGAEANYPSSELEALGVVWATRHFHHYLYGHKCYVMTDNVALKSLLATPHPSGKLARWGMALQELDLIIQHRSGKENSNADALSWFPVQDPVIDGATMPMPSQKLKGPTDSLRENSKVSVEIMHICPNCNVCDCNCNLHSSNLPSTGMERLSQENPLQEEQLKDPKLKLYIDYLEQGIVPEDAGAARRLTAERNLFEVVDGTLFRVEKDETLRLVPPVNRRRQLISDLHGGVTGGHLGARKTLGRVKTHYWLESVRRDVFEHCSNCVLCRSRKSGNAPIVPLKPIPVGGPWECMGVDVLKLPQSRSGKTYVVVFQDYLTKWPEAYPVTRQDTLTIAHLLVEKIVPNHGVPKRLLSDWGGCFLSQLMYEVYRLLGVEKLNTTAYHPQTDGLVERMNRTLVEMLSKVAHDDPKTWDLYLPYVLFAYWTSPHDSTQLTPFTLLYGREAVLPTDQILLPHGIHDEVFSGTYVEEIMDRMSAMWELARQNISKAQARQKTQHDKQAKEPEFRIGDTVLLYSPKEATGPLRKLALPNKGPYVITNLTETNVFVVPADARGRQTPKCVAWNRVCPCPNNYREESSVPTTATGTSEAEPEATTNSPTWKERLRPRIRMLSTTGTSSLMRGRCNDSSTQHPPTSLIGTWIAHRDTPIDKRNYK